MPLKTIAVLLALAVTVALHLLTGDLYINLLDEGIYLEGAARMAAGEVIYRDFFALTGPGTYWLVSALFRIFGTSLPVARWIPLAGLGVMIACVFYLTARSTSRRFAAFVTFCYLGLMVVSTDMMVVNHRLDSAALAMLGVTLSIAGSPFAAGAAAAGAAWATPPMLALTLAILAWRIRTGGWKPYLAGAAACSAPAVIWLIATGALSPMLHHLLWTASNYSGANRAFYGSIVGGWAALFDDASGFDLVIRGLFVGYCLMLPAILPPVALTVSALRRWKSAGEWFLALCGAALIVSTYPRPSITNLRYLCGLFVVLAAVLIYRIPRLHLPLAAITGLLSVALLWTTAVACTSTERTGTLRAKRSEAAPLRAWLETVPAGATSFAFPYKPVAVFLAGARNPTRYSYLQPGMMTDADEQSVLGDLERNPPEWVHHTDVPPEAYFRIWPSSDPKRLRMPRIEAFLARRYTAVRTVDENGLPVHILHRRY